MKLAMQLVAQRVLACCAGICRAHGLQSFCTEVHTSFPLAPAAGICGHDWVMENGADVVEGELSALGCIPGAACRLHCVTQCSSNQPPAPPATSSQLPQPALMPPCLPTFPSLPLCFSV